MRTYLVVANQTLGGAALATKVAELGAGASARFHVVVPASRTQEGLTWTAGAARARAAHRLDRALCQFAEMGIEATGTVADESPILAVLDALRTRAFDEILLCTLPAGASRWLKQDLPRRMRKHVCVPVSHVVSEHERQWARDLVAA
jgi:hypothetical protein